MNNNDSQNIDLKDNETVSNFFNDLSKDYFKQNYGSCNRLYIDLDCLFDFDLGALISLLTTEEEYQIFRKHLPDYERSFDGMIAKHFPELNFTETQIKERKNDGEYQGIISMLAPSTTVYLELFPMMKSLIIRNSKFDGDENLLVQANSKQLVICPVLKNRIKRAIIDQFQNKVKFKFGFGHIHDFPKTEIENYDIFLLQDIKEFVQNPVSGKWLFEDDIFVDKKVMAFPIMDETLSKESKEEQESVLRNTSIRLNIHCQFAYMPKEFLDEIDQTKEAK
jgi:hypothetical protein